MPYLNYTTAIPAQRSLGEMLEMLAHAGAEDITVAYAGGRSRGVPTGLAFVVPTSHGPLHFRLPVDLDAVLRILRRHSEERTGSGKRIVPLSAVTPERGAAVGWRVLRAWLAAQLAIIEAGLVTLDQVMLPYALTSDGRTVYQLAIEHRLALPAPRMLPGEAGSQTGPGPVWGPEAAR